MKNYESFDILIIGAGAVGCAVARTLSQYELKIGVLEKECDVALGASGRNSAVVHAGFNNRPGSLMAKYCVQGNEHFESLCEELDIPYKKTGKLIVAFNDEDVRILHKLLDQGKTNGCRGLQLIGKDALNRMAPGIGGIAAMESPNTAIFDPFLYTIALAENAAANGIGFYFNHEVEGIEKADRAFVVRTGNGVFNCRYIINCAGLHSAQISKLAGVAGYEIHPCRGEYLIMDKVAGELLPMPVYPVPRAGTGGLGVHLTPTMEGNIIIGPSAEYVDSKGNYSCTQTVMEKLYQEAKKLLPAIKKRDIIGSYSGLRSKQAPESEGGFRDFIIQEEADCPGLINLIGIESPGLTSSVPIATRVREILAESCELKPKENYIRRRKGITRFREQTMDVQKKLIEEDPDYGEVICRCQQITKHEIREAIENPLGVCSLTSIKYRAWPMTGRCQGGYCLTRIVKILEDEYGYSPEQIDKCGFGSELFVGRVK